MTRHIFDLLQTSVLAAALLTTATLATAAPVMPAFAGVPTGWTTDRYDPASFSNVGTYQGRSDVLRIGINSTTDAANRGAGLNTAFYNTQGRQTAITGGAGSVLAADLFIDSSWRDGQQNGYVRTDMWGVMTNGAVVPAVTEYPIIGFTNFGNAGARYRVWDNAGAWVDSSVAVVFGAWTSFEIEFTGTTFEYRINGVNVFSDAKNVATTGFGAVIMQAFNFNETSVGVTGNPAYVAHWANVDSAAQVPEPGSIALSVLALLALGAATRRSRSV